MPVGLKVININNHVQIDGQYKNLAYQSSVSGIGDWELEVNLDYIYVMSPQSGAYVGVAAITRNGLPYYHFFGSCRVHIYSANQNTGRSGTGIRVFNEKKELVFNSSRVQLKILDYLFGDLGPRTSDIRYSPEILLHQKLYSKNSVGILLGQSPVGMHWYKQVQRYCGLCFNVDGGLVTCKYQQVYYREGRDINLNSFESYTNVNIYSFIVVDTTGID